MSAMLETWLPHIGASLVVACISLALTRRFTQHLLWPGVIFVLALIICLAPIANFSLSHYIRVITGDLSITSLIWLSFSTYRSLTKTDHAPHTNEITIAAVIVAVAMILYPTALGLTYFDLYKFGFYPIVLGPVVFVVFGYCLWFRYRLAATILAAGFICYAIGALESDNLWDYLLDPVIVIYSIYVLITSRTRLPRVKPNQQEIEILLGLTIATFLVFAVYLSRFNHDAFRYEFVVEDGFIEWCTVLVLFSTMLVCAKRIVTLRRHRNYLFLGVTTFLMLLCLFGAGEEISWGQRIFGLETPDYLADKNAQGEIGLHNLVIEINGEEVKLNKLIFGTGLALGLLIYLFIATPLYRTQPPVRTFFNSIAAPMPRNYQIAGYLLVVATVEMLIDSSKRGEMTEFAGSIMFALNVIYPDNPEIFNADHDLNGKGE